ncbi:hypothetical protein J5N58_24475 [Rhizobium cremeum]|uniref:hypothetical protein n=1 Tax=Rhizobium cremeum TaxID=2813827 RepID=UPI001FD02D1E|nr:hypothetical protein [Rhizobium cremeum]MCJ7997749.1 hypothetical protein [Rhizobium cremeum]MCJ8002843.1 hypothetical protein [Rhizobium cremeum]
MDNDEYECVCDWLQLKWLPIENPSAAETERMDEYLALPDSERSAAIRSMSEDEAEWYIELETARALYVDPVDRGGITAAKLARYPDRYRWDPEKPADSERGRQSRTNVL